MKTAVETLIYEWCFLMHEFDMKRLSVNIYISKLKELEEKAKQMEKEQMKNAYWYGEYDGHNGSDRNFEQYYNETYKNTNDEMG